MYDDYYDDGGGGVWLKFSLVVFFVVVMESKRNKHLLLFTILYIIVNHVHFSPLNVHNFRPFPTNAYLSTILTTTHATTLLAVSLIFSSIETVKQSRSVEVVLK